MGNDQVRFDLTVKALGDYEIVAPIREIQKEHTQTRAYEQAYLEERGFAVRAKQQAYTINENLLGLTMSGGEIDRWEAPGEGARGWCAPRAEWPAQAAARCACASSAASRSRSTARRWPAPCCWRASTRPSPPMASAAACTPATPPSASRAASCTRRPASTALLAAHRALEEAVLTKAQNRFKPAVGEASGWSSSTRASSTIR